MNRYIKKKHVMDMDVSEIDFDLQEEFGFDSEVHKDFVELQEGHGNADAYPIKIDVMLEKLNTLKRLGATHIEIDYHCDHIGYEISGYLIRLSTQNEINEYENKLKEKREKSKKREELLRQLHELDNPSTTKRDDEDLPF